MYVPSLYRDEYNPDGTLKSLKPIDDAAPAVVHKRVFRNMDEAYVPTHPPGALYAGGL